MNEGVRIRVAGAMMAAVLAALVSVQAHGAVPLVVRYACDAGQSLTIQRDAKIARVDFIDRSYEVQRKRSSIGVKYVSPTAALIIDGPSAIFVAEDRWQLGACDEAIMGGSRLDSTQADR